MGSAPGPAGDFHPPKPLCRPYLQTLAMPPADSTRFTVGRDVIDLLPPYSSKTSRATGETRGGMGKSGVLEDKSGNISEMRKVRPTMEGL